MNLNNCIIFFIFLLIIYLLYKKQEEIELEYFGNTCNVEAVPCGIINCPDGKIKAQQLDNPEMCKCCDADIKNESEKQLILYYSFDQYTINTNNEMINLAEPTVKYNALLNNVNIISNSIIGTNAIEFNEKSFIDIKPFNLLSNKFTISLWLNKSGTVANRSILNFNNNIYIQDMISYIVLGVNSKYGSITYNFYDIGNYKNNWCHLVWVSNGNTWTLYLNNKKTVVNNKLSIDENITFVNNKIGNGFTGKIDDFKFYNSELIENDITELYNLGKNNVVEIKNNNLELELPNDYVFINNSLINTNAVTNANRIGVTSTNPIVGPCFLSFNPPPYLCYIGFSEYPFEVKGIRYGCTYSGSAVDFFTPLGPSNSYTCTDNDPEITIKIIYDGTKMIYYVNNQIIFSIERKINEPLYVVASTYFEKQMINNINFGPYTESNALITSSAPVINSLNLDSSLVYLLTFEKNTFDNTNKKILNTVKNGLNANINGDIYYSVDDNIDVLQLNNIKSQYITLDTFKLDLKKGITFSFWFKGTNSDGWARIIDWGLVTNTNNIIIAIDNNTKFNFGLWNQPGQLNQSIQLTNFNYEWIHFAWSMDPLTKKWNVYLNGLIIKTLNNAPFPFDVQRKLYIGRSQTGNESNLNGFLTDFRVYNRVLNNNEINTIFTSHKLNNIIKVFKNLNYNQNKILLYLASQITSPDATLKAIENDSIINLDISNNTIINKTTNVPLSSTAAKAIAPTGEVVLLDSNPSNITIVNNKVSAWKNFVQSNDISRPIIKNNLIDFSNSTSIGLTQNATPVTTSILTLTFVFKLTLLSTNIKTLVITSGKWTTNNINLMINNKQFVISIGNAGDYYTTFFPVIDTMYILTVVINSTQKETTSTFRVNGQQYDLYTHSGKSLKLNNKWDLGFWNGDLNRGFAGGIGYFIQYNKLLTKTEHESLEGFLANRWNINTLLSPEHPYYVKPLLTVNKYGDMIISKQTIEFKRLEDYIKIVPFKINSTGLSFSFWYKTSGTPSMSKIFDFGNGPNNKNMYVAITNNINLLFVVNGTNSSQVSLPIVKFNNWVHICWTLDPIQNKWLIYENGQLSITYDAYYPDIINREYNYIGKSNAADPLFTGSIDDFRMYYKTINQSDVQILYNQQNLSYLNDDESLVLHYTFENQNNQIIRNNGKNDYDVNYEITNKGFNDFVINNYLVSNSLNKVSTSFSHPSIIQSGELEVGNNALSTPLSIQPFTPKNNGITIAYWFKSNKSPNNTFIFDFNGAIIMYVNNNQLWCGVSGSNMVFFNTNINDNIWRHVIWVINSNKWEFYINGELINTITTNIKYPPLSSLNSNILAKSGFIGSINDFRLYNRVLNSDEFINLYNLQKLSDISGTELYIAPILKTKTSNYKVGLLPLTFSSVKSEFITCEKYKPVQTGITFTFWFKSSATQTWGRIFDFGNGPNVNNILATISNNKVYFSIRDSKSETSAELPINVNDNVWRHIVWIVKPVNTTWEIYLNEVLVVTKQNMKYPADIELNNNYLGKSNWAQDPFYNGSIDDFRVYHKILNSTEISNLYNLNNYVTKEDNLIMLKSPLVQLENGFATFNASDKNFVSVDKISTNNNGLAISCSFKSFKSENYSRLFDFGNGKASDNIIVGINNNKLFVSVFKIVNDDIINVTWDSIYDININDGVTRHLIWTMLPNGEWSIYINGQKINTKTDGLYPTSISRNKNFIGKSNWLADPYFNGQIDNFIILNRPLSNTDISNLYNQIVTNDESLILNLNFEKVSKEYIRNNTDTNLNGIVNSDNYIIENINNFITLNSNNKQFINIKPFKINNYGLTFSLWFKTTSTRGGIFDFGNGQNYNNISVELNNNQLIFFVAGVLSIPINFDKMNTNQWIHVAWVLSSVDNKWKIYKNGILINSVIANYPEIVTRNQNYIGKLNNNLFFDGSITYFKVYNKCLNNNDILSLYNQEYLTNSIYNQVNALNTPINNSEFTVSSYTGINLYKNGVYKTSASSNSLTCFNAFNNSTNTLWESVKTYGANNGNYSGTNKTNDILGEWLQIQLPYQTVIKYYSLVTASTSANTAISPSVFSLFGSNDGTTWTIIDNRNVSSVVPVENQDMYYIFNNKTAYSYYRLVVSKLFGGNNLSLNISLRQFNLFSSDEPIPYTNTTPVQIVPVLNYDFNSVNTNIISYIDDDAFRNGLYKASASSIYNNNSTPNNIFNSLTKNNWTCATKDSGAGYSQHAYNFGNYVGGGNNKVYTTTKIMSEGKSISDISGEWIQIELPYTTIMTSYNLITSASFENFPGLWYIVGSNNGTTWELIDKQDILSANINNNFNIIKPVTTPYNIFRLIVSSVGPKNNKTVLSYYINLAKWNIFGIINSNYKTTKNVSNLLYNDPSIIINYDFKLADMKRIINRKNNELIGILSNPQSIISSGNNKTFLYPTFNNLIISKTPRNTQIGIAMSKDNITTVVCNYNGLIYYYKNDGAQIQTLQTVKKPFYNLCLTADGLRGTVIVNGEYCYFFTWDATKNNYSAIQQTLDLNKRNYTGLSMSADGSIITVCVNNDYIYWAKWNGTNYDAFVQTQEDTIRSYHGIACSHDGKRIAYATTTEFVYWANFDSNTNNFKKGTLIPDNNIRVARNLRFNSNSQILFYSVAGNENTLWYTLWDETNYQAFTPLNQNIKNIDAHGLCVTYDDLSIYSSPYNSWSMYKIPMTISQIQVPNVKVGNRGLSLNLNSNNIQYLQFDKFMSSSNGMTFSFWFKFSKLNNNYTRIVDFSNGEKQQNIIIYVRQPQTIGIQVDTFVQEVNLSKYNDWFYFTWSMNKNMNTIYVNSKKILLFPGKYPIEAVRKNNYISKTNDSWLNGSIADFKVFNKELSINEIVNLYLISSKKIISVTESFVNIDNLYLYIDFNKTTQKIINSSQPALNNSSSQPALNSSQPALNNSSSQPALNSSQPVLNNSSSQQNMTFLNKTNYDIVINPSNDSEVLYDSFVGNYYNLNQPLFINSLETPDNDFSMCFWFKTKDVNKNINILTFENENDKINLILTNNTILINIDNFTITNFTNIQFNTNIWNHICLSFNKDKTINIYINSVLEFSDNFVFPNSGYKIFNKIGDNNSITNGQGYIADFRLYNKKITKEDIKSICVKNTNFKLITHYDFEISNTKNYMIKNLVNNNFEGDMSELNMIKTFSKKNGTSGLNLINTRLNNVKIAPIILDKRGFGISLWYNQRTYIENSKLFEFINKIPNEEAYLFGLNMTIKNRILVCTVINNKSLIEHTCDIGLSNNKWIHISWVLNQNGISSVYINGKLFSKSNIKFYPDEVTLENCMIGKGFYDDKYIDGFIDDFKIYSGLLSENEIKLNSKTLDNELDTSLLDIHYLFKPNLIKDKYKLYNISKNTFDGLILGSNMINTNDNTLSVNSSKNQYIKLSEYEITDNGLSFSIKFKANINNTSLCKLFDFSNGNSTNNMLYDNIIAGIQNNILYFAVYQENVGEITYNFNQVNVNDNKLHHLVWNLGADSITTVYLDSVLIYSNIRKYPKIGIRTNNFICYPDTNPFNGSISEFRVYSKVLSEKDVYMLYSNNSNVDISNTIINNESNFIKTFKYISPDLTPTCNKLNYCVAKENDIPYCYGSNTACKINTNDCFTDYDCTKYNSYSAKFTDLSGSSCTKTPSKEGCSNELKLVTQPEITKESFSLFSNPWSNNTDGFTCIAVSGDNLTAVFSSLNGFMYYSKFDTKKNLWGPLIKTLENTVRTHYSISINNDGTRGVVSIGNNSCYYFTWIPDSYNFSALIKINDIIIRDYRAITMVPDGSRIIACVNNDFIYYSKWENNNYSTFIKTLDTTKRTYNGIGVTTNGNRIVFSSTNSIGWADWNGTNYNINNMIDDPVKTYKNCKISSDNKYIYVTVSNNSIATLWYSYWNTTTLKYERFSPVPINSIPANFDATGLSLQPDNSTIYVCGLKHAFIYKISVLNNISNINPQSATLDTLQKQWNTIGCKSVLSENDNTVKWWRTQDINTVKNDMSTYYNLASTCSGNKIQNNICLPNSCLPITLDNILKTIPAWGMYSAETWNSSTNILPDLTGNKRDATTKNVIFNSGKGNGALGNIKYLSGYKTSSILWPTGSIPANFTICSVTRYKGTSNNRILQSVKGNWLHGHWGNKRGVTHYDKWINPTSKGSVNDWVVCCGKNNGMTPNNIVVDNLPSGEVVNGTGNYQLSINSGGYSNEYSDWEFSQLIIWDKILSNQELLAVSEALNNYLVTGKLL